MIEYSGCVRSRDEKRWTDYEQVHDVCIWASYRMVALRSVSFIPFVRVGVISSSGLADRDMQRAGARLVSIGVYHGMSRAIDSVQAVPRLAGKVRWQHELGT